MSVLPEYSVYQGKHIINQFIFANDRDLSNNNLTGGLPEFLAKMKSLLVM